MKLRLDISGMSCGHCAGHVTQALNEIGANSVEVDLKNNCAYLELTEALPEAALREAIVEAGYQLVAIKPAD